MSDSQITVAELIRQLQECPQDALVDIELECPGYTDYPSEVKIAHDKNIQTLTLASGAWVLLRGFK